MTLLQSKDLSFAYKDGTKALKKVNISIDKNSCVAILGGNGAGKSTLFLNLNGILKPSEGEVWFDDKPISYDKKSLIKLRKKVGIVFQDPDDQLFSASVYQDISFGAMNLNLPEDEVRRRVDWAMQETGISHLKNKPTHALSFGQKKRVAIAGTLVMEPELLILDEPTAGLDPMGVSELMEMLMRIKEQRGLSIALATHDIDIVPLYCEYCFLLDNGEVVMEGTPEQLISDPELLRKRHLRLPRIAHLMEILYREDGFEVSPTAATISAARKELLSYRDKLEGK